MHKFPNALVIMLGFILFVSILTYLIPHGQYERIQDPVHDYETVVQGSFTTVKGEPLSVFQIFMAIPEGIISAADLVVLILLIGGSFYVIEKTGALKEGIIYMTDVLKGKEEIALIIVSFVFAAGGALNGLQEEIIAMTPVLLFFSRRLGYNPFVTVAISYGSAVLGSSFSPMNPFAVAIAQKYAELPFLSGSAYRMVIFTAAFILWTYMIIRYANKNRIEKEHNADHTLPSLSARSIIILSLTALAFVIMIYGLLWMSWGFNEMSAEFFVLGIAVGLIGKLGMNGTSEAYIQGFKEMTFAAMIMGLAKSITLILQQGMIIDTIIFGLFTPLQYLPKSLAAVAMMVSQSLLHLPVPSYSGQAIMTMPVLSPLSDLIGLSRQVCVLAYQYGAVMMDMVVPTNGALMAIITIAGISYNKWLIFIMKPALVMMALCASAIIIAVFIGY
jgi:uncharacterized ion transporter superfamily protein YfcC